MKPTKRTMEFEQVKTDDFLAGSIEEVQYDQEHIFGKGSKFEKVAPATRFKFKLDGYSFPHYSRWLTFSYHEKSVLLNKYLIPLVEGAKADFDFEMDLLTGMRIKTLWVEKNGYQNIETIRPEKNKLLSEVPF
jgi:hypothetical protein